MTTTSAPAPTTATRPAPTRRVTDAPTRMFHWLFALCFVGAYLTSDGERLRLLHVVLGYSAAGLLGFRALYGLVGPRQARLTGLWARASGGVRWLRSLGAALSARSGAGVNWRQCQNGAMALAVVAILLAVVPLTASGYATFNDWGGEWLEEVHEALGEALVWLVVAHLGLLLAISVARGRNQALPMLTGRIDGAGPDLVKHDRAWLAALVLAALVGYWAWEWQQPAPVALGEHAASHSRDDAHDRGDRDARRHDARPAGRADFARERPRLDPR